jgi:hypothetical protein
MASGRDSRLFNAGSRASARSRREPAYASEGAANEGCDPGRNLGDLRVGGPNDGAGHCWVFAEFVLLHEGNREGREWL